MRIGTDEIILKVNRSGCASYHTAELIVGNCKIDFGSLMNEEREELARKFEEMARELRD
jgi:hypothetical protein